MADMLHIAAIGDIEITTGDPPETAFMIVPAVLQDGTEIALRLELREINVLWEFLVAVRQQLPGAMGLQ